MPDCLFCQIARGAIPSARILETDQALAFLDIGPLSVGHLLVIPKDHHASLLELPDELAAQTAALLPRLCRAVKAATRAEGLNVVVNTGRVAGQSVDHVHWHIIPRSQGDHLRWPWPAGRYAEGEMDEIQRRIVAALV